MEPPRDLTSFTWFFTLFDSGGWISQFGISFLEKTDSSVNATQGLQKNVFPFSESLAVLCLDYHSNSKPLFFFSPCLFHFLLICNLILCLFSRAIGYKTRFLEEFVTPERSKHPTFWFYSSVSGALFILLKWYLRTTKSRGVVVRTPLLCLLCPSSQGLILSTHALLPCPLWEIEWASTDPIGWKGVKSYWMVSERLV